MDELESTEIESPTIDAVESADQTMLAEAVIDPPSPGEDSTRLKAVIEAAIYITDEPLTAEQIANATEQPLDQVQAILAQLVREYSSPERGLSVRELAGGYKMATKPEYHEAIRRFVKRLQPPLKLSLAALETLAVIAYKQPITGPEILEIRGVQGAGVVKTLLDRKLIVTAGRKNVLGKPMMYKTSKDFLIQFGLNSLSELPTLKEFEELGRMAVSDEDTLPSSSGDSMTDEWAAEHGSLSESTNEPGTPEPARHALDRQAEAEHPGAELSPTADVDEPARPAAPLDTDPETKSDA